MTRYISLAGEMFSQSAAEEIGIYDCAENGAGTCQNVDYIDELRARAEAAEAEVARLRALIETLYVRVNYGEHGEIDNPTPVMCVGVHPIRWGKMAAPTMGFYPFRLPDDE